MLLFLSFLALALGPLLVWLARAHAWSTILLDSFCLVTVGGFALLHLLPESAHQASWLVMPLALAGFLLPAIAERTIHHGDPGMRRTVMLLALLGIAAHATLDGLLLNGDATTITDGHDSHTHELTAWAIILHRVPEGVGIWWIVPRTLGVWAAIVVSITSVVSTLFGFYLGGELLTDQSRGALAMLQALLVGSLLHVVLHAHVPAPRPQGRFRLTSVGGAALGVTVLWLLIRDHFPQGEHGGPAHVFLQLAMESAPALLLAYALVGLCHAFLPANWLKRMTSGSPLSQALRGVAVGLPLPVCSCGVVPIYRELIRQGTSLAAGIAFLVATPELEVAAVMLTWQLMGGEVALVRVVMAAVLALAIGLVVAALAPKPAAAAPHPTADDEDNLPAANVGALGPRIATALRFGFGPAVDNTATWILAGLLLSAMLMPYVDPALIAELPRGLDVPIAALIGLPLYVCATGSTPLAAMLLAQGLSPGAVLALMLTGPATNVTTFGLLAKLHGSRVATVFAAGMFFGAVGLGYLANWLLPQPTVPALVQGHLAGGWFAWTCLAAIGAVFLFSLLRQGTRPFLERLFESPANVAHGEAPGCCGDEHDHHHHHDHHGHGHHHHGHDHDGHDHDGHAHGEGRTAFEPLGPGPAGRLRPPRPDAR